MNAKQIQLLNWKTWENEKLAQGWKRMTLFLPPEMAAFVKEYVAANKPKYLKRKPSQ